MTDKEQRFVVIQTKTTFLIPSVPHYIRVYGQENSIPISDLDDFDLKLIGEEWTKALMDLARKKRNKL